MYCTVRQRGDAHCMGYSARCYSRRQLTRDGSLSGPQVAVRWSTGCTAIILPFHQHPFHAGPMAVDGSAASSICGRYNPPASASAALCGSAKNYRGLGIMAPICGCRSLLRRAATTIDRWKLGHCQPAPRYQDRVPARAAGEYRIDCRSPKTASRCCGRKTSDNCDFPAPRPTLGSFALSSQTCWRCLGTVAVLAEVWLKASLADSFHFPRSVRGAAQDPIHWVQQ